MGLIVAMIWIKDVSKLPNLVLEMDTLYLCIIKGSIYRV